MGGAEESIRFIDLPYFFFWGGGGGGCGPGVDLMEVLMRLEHVSSRSPIPQPQPSQAKLARAKDPPPPTILRKP